LHTKNSRAKAQIIRVFQVYRMPEALPYRRSSYWTISLGNSTHILARGVAKGSLVRRGYILNRREKCEGEGHTKEGRAAILDVYIAPISPRRHDSCKCVGSNWIWI